MSGCGALSKCATRRASMSGLRVISANRTHRYRAQPKHWNASSRRCSRSACDDRLHVAAPFGLADLFALRLRPNPRRFSANFSQVAAGVTRRWPEVTVEGAILERCTAPRDKRYYEEVAVTG